LGGGIIRVAMVFTPISARHLSGILGEAKV